MLVLEHVASREGIRTTCDSVPWFLNVGHKVRCRSLFWTMRSILYVFLFPPGRRGRRGTETERRGTETGVPGASWWRTRAWVGSFFAAETEALETRAPRARVAPAGMLNLPACGGDGTRAAMGRESRLLWSSQGGGSGLGDVAWGMCRRHQRLQPTPGAPCSGGELPTHTRSTLLWRGTYTQLWRGTS